MLKIDIDELTTLLEMSLNCTSPSSKPSFLFEIQPEERYLVFESLFAI